jgi:transposase InsO family protein
MNLNVKQKVQRWKLAIQGFDFDIEHIPGKQNIIADGFSRFCTKKLQVDNLPEVAEEKVNSILKRYDKAERSSTVKTLQFKEELSQTVIFTETDPPLQIAKNIVIAVNNNELMHHNSEQVNDWEEVNPDPHFKIASDKYALMRNVHNHIIGHHGINRTIDKLKMQGHIWKSMRADVQQFVSSCPGCQKMRHIKRQINVPTYVVTRINPLERIAIDIVGPLPESDDGNIYILVVIDSFSRYVELVPMRDRTAERVAKALLTWICRYGCPAEILCDNAAEFTAEVVNDLCDMLQINQTFIHPGSHEENGQVERYNKEVINHITMMAFENSNKTSWENYLPLAQRILNSQIHSILGCTPVELMFGNNVNLDRFLLEKKKSTTAENKRTNLIQYVGEFIQTYEEKLHRAQLNEAARQREQLASAYNNESWTKYNIGDLILATYPVNELTGKPNKPSKLHTARRGPYKVESILGNNVYGCRHIADGSYIEFKVFEMYKYKAEGWLTPEQVASRDDDLIPVTAIQEHKFINNGHKIQKNMLVKVIYADSNTASWQSYENIKNVNIFHEYLRRNKLEKLIPKAFR